MPLDVALIFMLSLLTFRLLTTVIHELGHAIPALLLTKKKVTVYMGSLGNPEKSFQFQLGRLECFFKFNLFYWRGGLCVMHAKDISVRTSFIVTICGPLLSLLVAGIGILILTNYEFDDVTKLVIFALVFSCIVDFINNMIPNQTMLELHNGMIAYNDGTHLVHLFKNDSVEKIYSDGVSYFQQEKYAKAAETFEKLLMTRSDHEVFYRLAIQANLMIGNYTNAKNIQKEFSERFSEAFEILDFINLGRIQLHEGLYENALQNFMKAKDMGADVEEIQKYIDIARKHV
ncbi:peptidase M50B-like protein [Kordia sp. SMS9]|uniref:site-2 protease family protein n=1 Tax=Kordia sp. SMS9 TaxID=2282170 RepID=UPI000E0D90CD|nr:site-2 protease family protein [Kordia sp. SMS9]AXG71295.1 peptidase M50B-like protein [Kordia sp. SMS9]